MTASETSGAIPLKKSSGTLISKYATPLTTGLFAVSGISGVALFFHWAPAVFHEMHEWLSMVLLAPFAFHLWKNWGHLVNYAKRGALTFPLIASLVVALPFAIIGMVNGRSNPGQKAAGLMTQASLSQLAPILRTTPEALIANLKQHGYQVQSSEETLDGVAVASGKQASRILFSLLPGR